MQGKPLNAINELAIKHRRLTGFNMEMTNKIHKYLIGAAQTIPTWHHPDNTLDWIWRRPNEIMIIEFYFLIFELIFSHKKVERGTVTFDCQRKIDRHFDYSISIIVCVTSTLVGLLEKDSLQFIILIRSANVRTTMQQYAQQTENERKKTHFSRIMVS